eukprot:763318-Hanusia_phi.AAC.20
MLREKEENMKEIQQTRALLAFNDKPSTIEVEADLCQAVALQYAQDIPPVMRVRPVTSSKMVDLSPSTPALQPIARADGSCQMLTSLDPMEEHMLESESVSSFEMPASMDRIGELYPSLSQRVKVERRVCRLVADFCFCFSRTRRTDRSSDRMTSVVRM